MGSCGSDLSQLCESWCLDKAAAVGACNARLLSRCWEQFPKGVPKGMQTGIGEECSQRGICPLGISTAPWVQMGPNGMGSSNISPN